MCWKREGNRKTLKIKELLMNLKSQETEIVLQYIREGLKDLSCSINRNIMHIKSLLKKMASDQANLAKEIDNIPGVDFVISEKSFL